MRRMLRLLLGAALLLAPGQTAPRVSGVEAARTGTDMAVTLTLPPAVKAGQPALLSDPWRLYFDIDGVLPSEKTLLTVGQGTVINVRMALNRRQPPRTRVVIELTSKPVWRVERDGDGRTMRVVIEKVFAQETPPALPRGTLIYIPPAEGTASVAIDRREQIKSQLFAMAPAVEAMRAWTGPSDADLANIIAAAEQLSIGARAMQVTGSASDLALVSAIDAVSAAATARAKALADGTPQSRANAIAAATGALLLIENARKSEAEA